MFSLSTDALDPAVLKNANPECGALVTFEGWVRNHNEGHQVTALEYEAYETLALSEGCKIVEEARVRFGLHEARCVHRTGHLEIGELAVWVGVATPHRKAAFQACRYIIDEIKSRVPIWKKEFYESGDSGWVNCEHCHHHAKSREPDYSRQTVLPEIGAAGQEKLAASRVLVIGAGGLGAAVLAYLAGAGIGKLGIVEPDQLEASNLHRQFIYTPDDLGDTKADLAAEWVRRYNPAVHVETYPHPFQELDAPAVLEEYDLVVECTDCIQTKLAVNRAAIQANIPAVFGGIYQYEGQVQVYRPEEGASCLECLWPQDTVAPSCSQSGVLGPVPGVLGSIQALEALKQLLQLEGRLQNEILMVNLFNYGMKKIAVSPRSGCPAHTAEEVRADPGSIEVLLSEVDWDRIELVDIRSSDELALQPLPFEAKHLPMHEIMQHPELLNKEDPVLLVCSAGIRTHALAQHLRRRGYDQVYSLAGGLKRWYG